MFWGHGILFEISHQSRGKLDLRRKPAGNISKEHREIAQGKSIPQHQYPQNT